MTTGVGVITPSNNVSQWSRSYYPAMFLGNTSTVKFLDIQLAPSTDSYVYKTGSILAVWGSGGAHPDLFVNYKTGGSNGQATAMAVLVDTRIPSGLTTPGANDRYVAVIGCCQLFLQYLNTEANTGADVLTALATMNARVYNNTFAYIP